MGGVCCTQGRDEYENNVLFRKPEGKRLLQRIRRRWEDNIIMDLREILWEGGFIWLRIEIRGCLLKTR
jgi:hypothetical protein